MIIPVTRFVNAEMLAMAILAPVTRPDGSPVQVVQSTSLEMGAGTVRVVRRPGEPRDHFEDRALVEYMCFEKTPQDAAAVADRCWQHLEFAWAKQFVLDDGSTITVDCTESRSDPHEVPWPGERVRVYAASHLIVTRAIRA